MLREDLAEFKTILSQQLEELMGKAALMITELVDSGDRLIDPVDIATLESSRSAMLRLRDRESRLIRKIVASLQHIEDGTFGVCEMCEEEIGIARLKARPVTSHCIKCKTKTDKIERLYSSPGESAPHRYVEMS
jgi:DnaK suppressor protein